MAEWVRRLRDTTARVQASDLYCGRAFREAEATSAHGALFIASAGLGLISGRTFVPSYSLTVTNASDDNVLRRLQGTASPFEWWQHVEERSPFSTSLSWVASDHGGPILVALPAPYLRMVEGNLVELPSSMRRRLRVFTRLGPAALPAVLRPYLMPYDARLDGKGSSFRGTHGDFAQRAARHFVESVFREAPGVSAMQHRTRVEGLLSRFKPPKPELRLRVNDKEIARLIRLHWTLVEGSSTRMLRYLRDNLQVACEQSRFQAAFLVIKAERGVWT